MSASRRLRGWVSRGSGAPRGDERPPRPPHRNRRWPRFDGLETRQLLSGNPAISEFPVSSPIGEPLGITRGPDGDLWFTQSGPNNTPRIGRITTAGVVTGFAADLTAERQPVGIAAGPDGNLWFTEPGVGRIGRITTAGVLTEFSAGITPDSEPSGITAGPDGNLWFTENGAIGRITPAGAVTEFTRGVTPDSQPIAITSSPDGNLWFAELAADKIGRITPAGVVTEFSAGITPFAQPEGITDGPDGNLWFTEFSAIGRITPTGVVTEFSAGILQDSSPSGITVGPDGNLWFAEDAGNRIGRITTAGVATEFSAGIRASASPQEIALGADGNLWFTENTGHSIGRLDLSLVGAGTTISTREGQPFVGTVATFTDRDPTAAPGNFTATIDWGDGTTSSGEVLEDASGKFYVSGSHTYVEEGTTTPIVVTIADSDGDTTTANSTADVAQAPLLATGVPVSATEGIVVRAGTLVATFIDTGGVHLPQEYAATINWGDGTAADPAVIQFSSGNLQVVTAVPHTYKVPGNFTVLVTIQDLDPGNPRAIVGTALAGATATVADARLTEVAVDPLPSQPKGTLLSGVTVGSFFDGNAFALPADFTAMIDWGDGSPLTLGTITQPNGPGSAFAVAGSHTYTVDRAQPYAITVTILDRAGRGLTTGTSAAVADAPPIVGSIPVRMTQGQPFTAPLAYIVGGAGLAPESPGHFTATIDWGDGTSSAGLIEAVPGGEWVVGSHTYARSGSFTITVTIHDDSGFTVAATTQAIDPPAVPAGPLHHGRHGPSRTHHKPRPSKPHQKAGPGHAAIRKFSAPRPIG
jgi:streptogramin lyase